MKPATLLGKLYLIPTTMGDCDPMDVLPQTVKKNIDLLITTLLKMKKQLKSIKVHPEKKQSELVLLF
jgi:16S rRNA (cytidine1402-2'-O)-methyltransferase